MFVATVEKFPFVYPGILGFLLTKAGNSLCQHATFISFSVCFLTCLIINTCWHPMTSNTFVKTFFGKRIWSLLLAAGTSMPRRQVSACGRNVHQSQGENGPAIAQTQKLLEHTAGWATLQTASLPRKLQCRGRKKAMVFTCISACHAAQRVCSQPRGFP